MINKSLSIGYIVDQSAEELIIKVRTANGEHHLRLVVVLQRSDLLIEPFKSYKKTSYKVSWDHRCTQVEKPGEGVPDVFAKIPREVKAFWKNCMGVSLFRILLRFY